MIGVPFTTPGGPRTRRDRAGEASHTDFSPQNIISNRESFSFCDLVAAPRSMLDMRALLPVGGPRWLGLCCCIGSLARMEL